MKLCFNLIRHVFKQRVEKRGKILEKKKHKKKTQKKNTKKQAINKKAIIVGFNSLTDLVGPKG